MKNAIVIYSGGQDSTALLFHCLFQKEYDKVIALTFNYGQNNYKELRASKEIIRRLDEEVQKRIKHKVVDISNFFKNVKSSLINDEIEIEENEEIPNTFVPGRNIIFLSSAGMLAKEKNIKDVYIGVNQIDFSGYPDCKLEFINSMEETLRIGLEFKINILVPLIHLSKVEIWKFIFDIGEPVYELIKNETVSCYEGFKGQGCGNCSACKIRNKSLNKFKREYLN